ncbi:PREDICTED: mavicyanin-like [Camelina sativa]|uniref:Mavicyanin-like n=1 Tax=Camelina sativa TaxID=90675 RepID=A0ABM0TF31_CAMSA|nr:PREDICTED: mavicyanin-like [Camelina sativa]
MKTMQAVLVILVFSGLVAVQTTLAAQHVIGGSQGWEQSVDFDSWASDQSFKVGDQLVFKYSGLHSVVELGSETAYKSCDVGTPVNSLSSGNDVVKLSKTGTRYFACGTVGHCEQGMKIKVNVVSSDSKSASSPGSGSDSGSGSGSESSSGHGLRASIGYIFVVGSFVIGLIWAY